MRPVLARIADIAIRENILVPQAAYGYWRCAAQGNDVILFDDSGQREVARFQFPRQNKEGGRLGENLIAMGLITADQIAAVINSAPAIPQNVEESGISERNLLYLLLKFMHVEASETVLDLAGRMKLPRRLVQQLIEECIHQRYIGATV